MKTAEDFREAQLRAAQQVGHVAVAGRYHHLPSRLEDDFKVSREVLGTGMNGSVLQATCRRTATSYAIKHFPKENISPNDQQLFANEVELFLGVDHPHVARLLHVYESESKVSLVVEHLKGGELYARLQDKLFSEVEAASAMWQMLLAVNYLHHEGITHRDIKIENFMYEENGGDFLKLIDFGFSKFSKHQNMNELVGTQNYVAPEVLKQKYAHGSCDLWSLGCLVFILLFGYFPFSAENKTDLVRKIYSGQYEERPGMWSRVSATAQDFVKSLLRVDPKKRLTAQQALEHPFIQYSTGRKIPPINNKVGLAFLSLARADAFTKACLRIMAWSLTLDHGPSKLQELRNLFLKCAATQEGVVLTEHLEELFRKEKMVPAEELKGVVAALKALDNAGDDQLHYSDFLAGMIARMLEQDDKYCTALLMDTFRRFDVQGQGYITPDSVKLLTGDSHEDFDDAFNQDHLHHKDRMYYREFVHYVSKGNARRAHKRRLSMRTKDFIKANPVSFGGLLKKAFQGASQTSGCETRDLLPLRWLQLVKGLS